MRFSATAGAGTPFEAHYHGQKITDLSPFLIEKLSLGFDVIVTDHEFNMVFEYIAKTEESDN